MNRYVKPHVDSIYINSNRRGELQSGPNWVKMAAKALDREDMTESTWLHQDQLYKLLERSVVSVTKQIKCVPVVYLIKEQFRDVYIRRRDHLRERLKNATSAKEEKELVALLAGLPCKYMDLSLCSSIVLSRNAAK